MFQMDSSGSWSLGVLLGGPAWVLGIAASVAFGAWALWYRKHRASSYDTGLFRGMTIGAFVLAALLVVGTLAGFYPWHKEYHQWRDVSGTVGKVDKRLISSGSKSMEDKFVIRFDGSSLQFGCDDTRCAQVDEGDSLTLSCKRAWQYTGTDGYDCRFVSTEAAR